MNNPTLRVHYCKSLLKTGKPIVVLDTQSNEEYNTDDFYFENCDVRVKFGNSLGKEKKRGAKAVLEIYPRFS